MFIETGFINTILSKINFISSKFLLSAILFFDFSTVKRREKTNSLDREHKTICFMFRNIFFLNKNTVGECETPSLLQKEKRRSAKSDVSKVLFPDIGKITNRLLLPGLAVLSINKSSHNGSI